MWHQRSFAQLEPEDRFFNLVDLVNQLEQEKSCRSRSGRLAEMLLRYDVIVIDELGYLPFSQPGGQLTVPSDQQALHENTSLLITTNLAFADLATGQLRRRQDDNSHAQDRLTHHCDVVETGNTSWRFQEPQLIPSRPTDRVHAMDKWPALRQTLDGRSGRPLTHSSNTSPSSRSSKGAISRIKGVAIGREMGVTVPSDLTHIASDLGFGALIEQIPSAKSAQANDGLVAIDCCSQPGSFDCNPIDAASLFDHGAQSSQYAGRADSSPPRSQLLLHAAG